MYITVSKIMCVWVRESVYIYVSVYSNKNIKVYADLQNLFHAFYVW